MIRKQRGNALVPFVVGLALGLVAGWLLAPMLGGTTLAEGERAVSAGALLVDEVKEITQLTEKQIEDLTLILENTCSWPDTCEPRPARDLLEEIRQWVDQAPIPEKLKALLRENVDRCLDPNLRNQYGVHVCRCVNPDPCTELRDVIWAGAEAASEILDPLAAEEAWLKVKSDFDHFPTGR